MSERNRPLISDFDAMHLKFLADQWKSADEELSRVYDEISRIKAECRNKLVPLQFREGDLLHERRFAVLEMTRIISELVGDRPIESYPSEKKISHHGQKGKKYEQLQTEF